MEIYKEFTFDSAHFLPMVPEGHKCKHMHGHTYHLKIYVEGTINEVGWIIDFGEIKKAWKPIEKIVDHKLLNDIEGLSNPTAENIVVWLWSQLKPCLPELSKLELKETPTSGVIYCGQ